MGGDWGAPHGGMRRRASPYPYQATSALATHRETGENIASSRPLLQYSLARSFFFFFFFILSQTCNIRTATARIRIQIGCKPKLIQIHHQRPKLNPILIVKILVTYNLVCVSSRPFINHMISVNFNLHCKERVKSRTVKTKWHQNHLFSIFPK